MGKPIKIELIQDTKEYIKFNNNQITISTKTWSTEVKKSYKALLYKNLAPSLLNSRVTYWQDKMQLSASKVSYRKTKRQWGSCSYKNAISLNTFLLMLPINLADYIIVHELAHITHKNHSKDFWNLVSKYIPNYKSLKKELKLYGTLLQ